MCSVGRSAVSSSLVSLALICSEVGASSAAWFVDILEADRSRMNGRPNDVDFEEWLDCLKVDMYVWVVLEKLFG